MPRISHLNVNNNKREFRFINIYRDIDVKRKNTTSNKETQANLDTKISVEDLTNPQGASETYWKILAEKRQ